MRIVLTVILLLLLLAACQPVLLPMEDQAMSETSLSILAGGADAHGTNGAMFGPDGQLYVASIGGMEILVLDPESGTIVDRIGPEQGVTGPDDLTFGPDGSLYWTNLFSGEIGRLTADGETSAQTVAPGVNPIAFSEDGRLFTALDFLGDGLYELDPNLQEPPRLIIEELGFLNAMDFGPDGLLYGPIFTQGRVVRIDVDADPPTVETVTDGMMVPAAVKFDSAGKLYALDQAAGQVLTVDTTTGEKSVLAQLPPGLDNLAFDADDRLFVTHADAGHVWEVMADGSTRDLLQGGMTSPHGVAVLPSDQGETVYVGNVFMLYGFDGANGEPAGDGRNASAVTVSSLGEDLLLTSWFAGIVAQQDAKTGETLAAYPDFSTPMNAIAFQGDWIVAELGTGSVVRADGDDPSQRTTLASELAVPLGLAATDDAIWVGDMATGMVWQLAADGEPLAEPKTVAQGLAAPSGMAVSADGDLLVVEAATGRLLTIDPETGEKNVVAEGLAVSPRVPEGAAPMLVGVAVGPSGAIYVAGNEASVVYRIDTN